MKNYKLIIIYFSDLLYGGGKLLFVLKNLPFLCLLLNY